MKKEIVKPQRMNMSVMRQLLAPQMSAMENNLFISKDLGISMNVNFFFDILKNGEVGPFVVEDYRLGMLLEGEIDVTVNLIHYRVTAGKLIYMGRGSIAHLHSVSNDLKVLGLIFSEDMMSNLFSDQKSEIIEGAVMSFFADFKPEDKQFLEDITQTIWHLVHRENYPKKALYAALSSLLFYYDSIYLRQNEAGSSLSENTRGREVFNRFISLVNQDASRERALSYYADQLCLSPRYLSTLINEQSGHTAKYWIDQATITRAKVLLRHSTKSVSQISDELHFPNDSFFCKYFRRLAGCSPTEYRG